LAVFVLIFINAFFVAGEFALVAVDRERIERRAQTDRRAAGVLKGLRTLSFQLSGAQLGITVSSLLLGFILDTTLGEMFVDVLAYAGVPARSATGTGLALALIVATATQMVLGELVPKNLAIARPVGVALAIVNPLRAVNALFKPIIVLFNNSANFTVRLLGIEPQEELIPIRSLEELGLLIESSREGGILPEEQFSLLSRSIAFGDKNAGDALVPRVDVIALRDTDPVPKMIQVALDTGHSRFPVYRNDLDDIVGVVHVKDVYALDPDQRPKAVVKSVMRDASLVPESRPLSALLVDMRRTRQQMAIVADEYGGTAGIITIEDLLEEIVGEIEDEHDDERVGRTLVPQEGIHVLSGMLHPDEVKEACGFEIPDGDYDTLAGFVLSLLRRIPEVGDQATYRGWELKVVEMDGRRIAKILLVAPDTPVEEQQS
jgi:CBS domain containing-hemolysin-like protein